MWDKRSSNRTILELKSQFHVRQAFYVKTSNRTILELKLFTMVEVLDADMPLIAPYWN